MPPKSLRKAYIMLMEAIQENRCLTHFREVAIQNDENKLNLGAQRSRVQTAGK